jgi:protein-S-isoprenylcysteine O-methyltransferase Ste14
VSPFAASVILVLAAILGSVSMLAFFVFFLPAGPFNLANVELGEGTMLGFNTLLCLAFFLQHSGMIRQGYCRWSSKLIPSHYQEAVYAIASGVVLLILVVFWQESSRTLVSVDGILRWGLRAVYCLAVVGMVWSILALGSFDGLGLRPILDRWRKTRSSPMPLTVRGPYRWVRHPLYLFSMLMIWAYPDMTSDRLLFNVLFTVWIVVGTVLEERDLVVAFGDSYRNYQREAPMLLPRSFRPMVPVMSGDRNDCSSADTEDAEGGVQCQPKGL